MVNLLSPAKIRDSFYASVGDIVFGMEDGTVSIFGLVFGVAATTSQPSVVLTAGATGAIAAAIAMMAGTFLDMESTRDQVERRAVQIRTQVRTDSTQAERYIATRLADAGMSAPTITAILDAVRASPNALAGMAMALELQLGLPLQQDPLVHALWMFFSDLLAAIIPIAPFAFFPIETARIVSVIITTALLILLGIGRGVIGRRNIMRTVLETVLVATAAAGAGLFIGQLIDTHFAPS